MKAIELLKKFRELKLSSILEEREVKETVKIEIDKAIEELEEYESDMDMYLDYTTGSRCSKSFNANLSQIKQAHDRWLDDVVEYNK